MWATILSADRANNDEQRKRPGGWDIGGAMVVEVRDEDLRSLSNDVDQAHAPDSSSYLDAVVFAVFHDEDRKKKNTCERHRRPSVCWVETV